MSNIIKDWLIAWKVVVLFSEIFLKFQNTYFKVSKKLFRGYSVSFFLHFHYTK